MKKNIFLLSVMICAATAAYGQQPQRLDTVRMTLEDCLGYAMGNSYGRQSVSLNEEARQSVLDQARAERWPSLSASLSENFSNSKSVESAFGGSYDLSAGITLFQGGQISETIRQSELQYRQTLLQTQQYDNELTVQILQAFLNAIGNEELLRYQQTVLDMSRIQARDGRAKWEARQILESDYLLLEAQLASDQNNITNTSITLENNLVALKALLSMDLAQPISLVYPDTETADQMLDLPSQQYVLERAIESLPDIKISDYSVEIAQTGLRISQAGYYPSLSLNGSIGTGHAVNFRNYGQQLSDRFSQQAGITLSIPIFNRARTRSAVTQSKIALQQAELDRKQTAIDVEQTIINQYGNVVAAGSQYRSSEIRQNAYMRSFEAYNAMFREGAITPVELVQQQNNYISAMNDYIQSKYTFILRRKILDVYMGEPVTM